MWGKVLDFARGGGRKGGEGSVLGRQIADTLCDGMQVAEPLERLFQWIEANRFFVDTKDGRRGHLFPPKAMRDGRTDRGRPGGTDVTFGAEPDASRRHWFMAEDDAEVPRRLCVFAQTGGDGSMAALWLADDGSQKIVHLGSGSGSVLQCVLADDPVDFLRLLAIGYDEICWSEAFSEPPNASDEFVVEPNRAFVDWVTREFGVAIPERACEIVRHPASMDDESSPDPFWQWAREHAG